MKKITYSLLAVLVFAIGFIKVDAQMITFDELKEQGKVIVNDVEETDNIYIIGDKIFTNFITLANIEEAGKTKDDVIKYDTSTTKWTYVDETKELDTEVPVIVSYDKDGKKLEVDYIYNAEELEFALSEENDALVLVLANDINNVKKAFEIKREITIDGNNKTISATKAIGYYGYSECFVLNETRARFKNVAIKGFNAGFYVDNSILDLEGNINLSNNDFAGILLEKNNSSVDATNATLVFENESFHNPIIFVYDTEQEVKGTRVKANNLTERFDDNYGESAFYLNEENIYYAQVELLEEKTVAYQNENHYQANFYADVTVSNIYNTDVVVKVKDIKLPEGSEGNLYVYNDDTEQFVEVKVGDPVLNSEAKTATLYDLVAFNVSTTKTGNVSVTLEVLNEKEEVLVEKELTIELKDVVINAYYNNIVPTNKEVLPEQFQINGELYISTNKELDGILEVNVVKGDGKVSITSKKDDEEKEVNGMEIKLEAHQNTFIPILIEADTEGKYSLEVSIKEKEEILDSTTLDIDAIEIDKELIEVK